MTSFMDQSSGIFHVTICDYITAKFYKNQNNNNKRKNKIWNLIDRNMSKHSWGKNIKFQVYKVIKLLLFSMLIILTYSYLRLKSMNLKTTAD